ncbi:hypothetical protein CSUB01_06723 [Colletotrichum sublineola]|uniref:Uncharacterized protein n=1 Tax=Colletotrichum sublineola TaxID=1173701 RepID=A0A066XFP7_COLSU|nr:hypothetical protein CSUB01_06723 [Colletotrichum sublineola]
MVADQAQHLVESNSERPDNLTIRQTLNSTRQSHPRRESHQGGPIPRRIQVELEKPVTCLASHESIAAGTARIAIPRAVPRPGLVRGIPPPPAIGVHGDEVQRAVDGAPHRRDVDVERELVPHEREGLIPLRPLLQQKDPRVERRARGMRRRHPLRQSPAVDDNAKGLPEARGVRTLDHAARGAGVVRAAEFAVPAVARVAVKEAVGAVDPAPPRVDDDLAVDRLAGGGPGGVVAASLPGETGVDLAYQAAGFLRLASKRQ